MNWSEETTLNFKLDILWNTRLLDCKNKRATLE